MKNENNKMNLMYKIYLIECLGQDIDGKIDVPPLEYNIFKKKLKKRKKCDIMEKKV